MFVSVVNPNDPPRFLVYSTYFGGTEGEVAYDIKPDSAGNLYFTGYTLSPDLFTVGAPYPGWGGGIDVFVAAIKAGLFTLAVVGVLASVVGAFYYLTIIKVMYFDEPLEKLDPMRMELRTVLAVAGLFNIFFFVYPGPLVSVATVAAKSLF